jgi:thiol-disulfide isomerase/thioredoxin
MRKSTILFACAGVAVLGIAVGIAFTWHATATAHAASRATSVANAAASKASAVNALDDDTPRVIRFVNHPITTPPFMINDLSGNPVSTANFAGKVVILSFWATWCPPCREEIPELIQLATRYKDRLEVIGISMDDDNGPDDVKKVQAFAAKMGMNYPVAMATKELVKEYGGVPALPTTFVLNRDSQVVQKHVGLISQEVYDTEIRSLLGMPVSAKVETFDDTGQVFLKNAALATELPGVDMSGLTDDQKKEALKRMNSESCTCGCDLTIAQCRINDESCDVSKELAAQIVKEVAGKAHNPDEVIHH